MNIPKTALSVVGVVLLISGLANDPTAAWPYWVIWIGTTLGYLLMERTGDSLDWILLGVKSQAVRRNRRVLREDGKRMSDICICDLCLECDGTGTIWYSPAGQYYGSHMVDDLSEPETCETCHGTGLDGYDPDCQIHGDDDELTDDDEEEWRIERNERYDDK